MNSRREVAGCEGPDLLLSTLEQASKAASVLPVPDLPMGAIAGASASIPAVFAVACRRQLPLHQWHSTATLQAGDPQVIAGFSADRNSRLPVCPHTSEWIATAPAMPSWSITLVRLSAYLDGLPNFVQFGSQPFVALRQFSHPTVQLSRLRQC